MEATLLTLGVLLVLIGLVGQVKAKDVDVGTRNPVARVILGTMGALFIGIALQREIATPNQGGSAGRLLPSEPASPAPGPSPEHVTPPPWVPAERPPARPEAGRIVERTDYPFVDDPPAVGWWRAVDFVPEPSAFVPGQRRFAGELFLDELGVLPGERTSMAWRWTRGLLLHDEDHTASHYEIRILDGGRYMFLEWKDGDYIFRHRRPFYYVLRWER